MFLNMLGLNTVLYEPFVVLYKVYVTVFLQSTAQYAFDTFFENGSELYIPMHECLGIKFF